MRAVWISRVGGPEVLEVRETPEPSPRAGEVRVRVRAAGLNFAEVMARQGLYPDAPRLPCVMGYEVAGVVDAAGEGVTEPVPGARVLALTRFGGHAEAVCVPARQAFPMPEGMSFEEGAALPVNYVTAWHMLSRVAALRPGETVLVHMAAGGVGIAALQLCRTVPGVVTIGTASAEKHEVIRREGCDHPVDYRRVDWEAEARRLTGGRGVEVVLDPLGGRDTRKGYRLLRPTGRIVAYGFANLLAGSRKSWLRLARQAVGIPLFNPVSLMNANKGVAGVNIGHLWGEPEIMVEEVRELLAFHREGKIRPRVDQVFPFGRAADAHRRIEERQNVGKVLLRP